MERRWFDGWIVIRQLWNGATPCCYNEVGLKIVQITKKKEFPKNYNVLNEYGIWHLKTRAQIIT